MNHIVLMFDILAVFLCSILFDAIGTVHGVYIYGLMLHNPIPDDLGLKSHDSNLYQRDDESKSIGISAGPQLPKFSSDMRADIRIRCKQDSDCIDDDDDTSDSENLMYCDRHYGFCDYFRQVGELCRHDSQCDSGLICMFGLCEKPFKPGHKGARCTDASECNEGLCCARQHGERICKPKLKLGQQCFVPLGGLDYSLNELCPCDEGLECHQVLNKSKNKRKRNWKADNVMRCSLPNESKK